MDPALDYDPADIEELECGCGQDGCPVCDTSCWYCGGEGWKLVGYDEDEDWERGWMMGDTIKCPNCHGSGKAKDCTFW